MARPETVEEAGALLRDLGTRERTVRPVGGGTKLGWGPADDTAEVVETAGLARILEHNVGDFTTVLEAGVPFAEAQAAFAEEGQMIAWDPPLGASDAATIGGIVATADSGPLRHRYGAVRDLVVGITVVLSDGTVARAGGKVIKNVAGYDLAKLFAGSFGTLGLIATVSIRLHPRPARTATLIARADDPGDLARLAVELARHPLEADCFDVRWEGGEGAALLRFSGPASAEQAADARRLVAGAAVEDDDEALWEEQRARQRGELVVKVSGRPTDLPKIFRAAQSAGGGVVARAALGLAWLSLPAEADVGGLREALQPRSCTVLDGAQRVADPWPAPAPGALVVMERLKARFDPARIFRPGAFVGGI